MERSRWYPVEEKLPFSKGKYWVYPYRTIGGEIIVAMMNFEGGKWEELYTPQRIRFWKRIDVPKPPRIPKEREI